MNQQMQNNIPIYFLSLAAEVPNRGYWDYGILDYILPDADRLDVNHLDEVDCAIVIVPAKRHAELGLVKELNAELAKVKKVILFLMGDEESKFEADEIIHPNIKIWVQYPRMGKHADSRYIPLPLGSTPNVRATDNRGFNDKIYYFFAGQVTHSRRQECIEALEQVPGYDEFAGVCIKSPGFSQGISQEEYYTKMSEAMCVPCPSGPATVDTFRLYEAMELGCVPIADNKTPTEDWTGYWQWLFGETVPFFCITDWSDLPNYIEEIIQQSPVLNNTVQTFWMRQKIKLKKKLEAQLRAFDVPIFGKTFTVIVPVSPIKSHPRTDIIDETLHNIKLGLPNADVMVTFDGVRPEQEKLTFDYECHIRKVLQKHPDIIPYIFDEHTHQAGMARAIIDDVETPLIVYCEQDTPIVIDEFIDWLKIAAFILSGESNLVRLHFEAHVPEEHKSLIIGEVENEFLKTVQWSQRPHIASTAFYRRMLKEHFSEQSKCFIEDKMHGVVISDWLKNGIQGWHQWRLHIYHPAGNNIKRSYHTDGRQGAVKFDESQIW